MASQNSRSRLRSERSGKNASRVPLTYYRSAGAPSKEDKSPFNKKKPAGRARKFIFGLLDTVVILTLLAIFFYSLIIKPEPSVSASSYTYHTAEVYEQEAKRHFQSFSSRNKLSINENEIIDNLKLSFPEIETGKLELPIISQKPKIHLKISEPAFVLKNSGSSYVVGMNGVAVSRTDSLRLSDKLPEVDDQTDFQIEAGRPALSSDSARFIHGVWRYIQKTGIEVESIVLPPLPMEMNLKAADQPYLVKFYLGGDPALQSGQFIAARKQFERDKTGPDEYLDVRVQGKIFYK